MTMQDGRLSRPARERLDSWQEIAAYFGRDERTVKRWEKERALPVHRIPGGARSGVFAYTEELARWVNGSKTAAPEISSAELPVRALPVIAPARDTPPVPRSRLAWLWALAGAALLFLLGIAFLRTRSAQAERNAEEARLASSAHPVDPQAKDLYLKGRYYWNKRTADGLTKAVDYFTQAIVRDPGYAQAYAGLNDAYNLLREYTAMPSEEAFPRAIAAARKALELDDNLPEAHAALAFASFWGSWDVRTGDREFRRALALNPHYVAAHHWYATSLLTRGRYPEALREIERARELDPTSDAILSDKALILYSAGDEGAAKRLLKQIETSDPGFISPHRYFSYIYLADKDYPDYLAEARSVASLSHDETALAITDEAQKGFAAAGAQGMLKATLAAEKKLFREGSVPAYSVASTCALLGEKQAALDYLRIAYQKHESALLGLRTDRTMRDLHNERAYQELVKSVGW